MQILKFNFDFTSAVRETVGRNFTDLPVLENCVRFSTTANFHVEKPENLKRPENLEKLEKLENLEARERLESFESLEKLENLENFERFESLEKLKDAIFALEEKLKVEETRNNEISSQVYVAFTFFSVICIPLDYFIARLIFRGVLVPIYLQNLTTKYVNLC